MSLTMNIRLTPNHPEKRMQLFQEYFGEALQKAHNACCFYILELCIRWTRVDTGRLRSGWIPFLASKGFNYQRSLLKPRDPKEGSIQEGLSSGRYQEGYLSLYVENGVNYAGYLNDSNSGIFDVSGAHSFRPAMYPDVQSAAPYFTEQYSKRMSKILDNADNWLKQIMKNGSTAGIEVPTDFGPPEATE